MKLQIRCVVLNFIENAKQPTCDGAIDNGPLRFIKYSKPIFALPSKVLHIVFRVVAPWNLANMVSIVNDPLKILAYTGQIRMYYWNAQSSKSSP